MPVFSRARPAEILRAAQKDDLIKRNINSSLNDLVYKALGSRSFLRYHDYIPLLADFLYSFVTTLSGLQTLGEEYTGIVQVTSELRAVPSPFRRLLMVTAKAVGSFFILYLLKYIRQFVNKNPNIRPEAKVTLAQSLDFLESILPLVLLSHKALFYFTGNFYDFPKRITGIHYVLVHRWLREDQPLYGFKVLGFTAVLHIFLQAVFNTKQWWQSQKRVAAENSENAYSVIKYKCPLCMDDLRQPSATLCGHLFCWNCILDWVQGNQRCPVCRVDITPSRIVPLQN
ncbi:unnamed protein product [Bemisia tabaci]|uniref:RING-type E3 ubiquitin transferase n=1 Tax=Bemisia tabaci TaxID=7038 RepID=A0A9N9ZZ07_BEMTA|nr:unnamed protein product [Bemisia tabaci]